MTPVSNNAEEVNAMDPWNLLFAALLSAGIGVPHLRTLAAARARRRDLDRYLDDLLVGLFE
jgi:hypothetical protein